MGEKETVNQIISFIPTINWGQTPSEVSLFETTIRYLGGMLSGYDFLKGPLAHLADNKANVDALLKQSINLANNLSYAFETPSGVPYNGLDFANRGHDGGPNGLATVGTLILEWTRLADLSGNKTYADLIRKAEQYLLHPTPASSEPFPGLLGMNIDVPTGKFLDAYGGWIGGADSFYEYLIKMWVYDPKRFGELKDRWIVAADSTIKYLTSHPKTRPDLTFVAAYNGRTLDLSSQHLACFDGGNFILAGQVLGTQKYIDYGLQLVNGCHETYSQTATKIGPESFGCKFTLHSPRLCCICTHKLTYSFSLFIRGSSQSPLQPSRILQPHRFLHPKRRLHLAARDHGELLLRLSRHRRQEVPGLGLGRLPGHQCHDQNRQWV